MCSVRHFVGSSGKACSRDAFPIQVKGVGRSRPPLMKVCRYPFSRPPCSSGSVREEMRTIKTSCSAMRCQFGGHVEKPGDQHVA